MRNLKVERRWKAHGLVCIVALNRRFGTRNGYVRLPRDHPWHGVDYRDIDSIDPDVHGGLTFSGDHRALGRGWWIGFDCGHAGDWFPALAGMLGPIALTEALAYWQEDEVADEVERLAEQAAAVVGA